MIHRDIKPHNILVMEDDSYCLSDFGISKVVVREGNQFTISKTKQLTKSVKALTELYSAPEIIKVWDLQD